MMFGDDMFLGYANHMQQLDDAVDTIVNQYATGTESLTLNIDDDISDADVDYIKYQVEKRLR